MRTAYTLTSLLCALTATLPVFNKHLTDNDYLLRLTGLRPKDAFRFSIVVWLVLCGVRKHKRMQAFQLTLMHVCMHLHACTHHYTHVVVGFIRSVRANCMLLYAE